MAGSRSGPPTVGARVSCANGGRWHGLKNKVLWHLSSLRPLTCSWPFLKPIKTLITLLSQLVSSSQLTPTPKLQSSNCKVILSTIIQLSYLLTLSSILMEYHLIVRTCLDKWRNPSWTIARTSCPTESQKCLRNIVCGLRLYLCVKTTLYWQNPIKAATLIKTPVFAGSTRSKDIRAFVHVHKQ